MKTTETKIIEEEDALKWLEKEYPHGTDLICIDYRDDFTPEQVQEKIKNGYIENSFEWFWENEAETIQEIIKEMEKDLEGELDEEAYDNVRNWIYEHDTSDPEWDLLKNTRNTLFFFETDDEFIQEDKENNDYLVKKYAKNEEEEKEIRFTMRESFYSAPVSFYFYLSPSEVHNAIHNSEGKDYILIEKAYFGTVDRIQGSNWIGNAGIFSIVLPKEKFKEVVLVDSAKGNGYGWDEIAGQCDYDEASVTAISEKEIGSAVLVCGVESEEIKRERELEEKWNRTKKCTFGDMNFKRHKNAPYRNEYPCGNKCEECGTFWID